MQYLLEYNTKKYSDNDLLDVFEHLGIKRGDILCVHSELLGLGKPLLPKNIFMQNIIDCFWKIIGEAGTLIMPTFTYSFCKNEVYDKLHSKSTVGILTDFYRQQIGVKRTNDPIFSFAVKGAKEKLFMEDTRKCFGNNSVYDMLAKQDGKIILFGTEMLGYTFSHYIEEKAKVDYRFYKTFSGLMINEQGNAINKEIDFYVRYLDRNSDLSISKQISILKQSNNFVSKKFAKSCIVSISAKKYLEVTLQELQKNPYCLLEDVYDNSCI